MCSEGDPGRGKQGDEHTCRLLFCLPFGFSSPCSAAAFSEGCLLLKLWCFIIRLCSSTVLEVDGVWPYQDQILGQMRFWAQHCDHNNPCSTTGGLQDIKGFFNLNDSVILQVVAGDFLFSGKHTGRKENPRNSDWGAGCPFSALPHIELSAGDEE